MNRVEKLIQLIKDKGLTVNAVERKADIEKGTLRRWLKSPPKTMDIEERIINAANTLSNEHPTT